MSHQNTTLTFQSRINWCRCIWNCIISICWLSIHSGWWWSVCIWLCIIGCDITITIWLRLCFCWCNGCTWNMTWTRWSSSTRWTYLRVYICDCVCVSYFLLLFNKSVWHHLPELGEFWLPLEEVRGGWLLGLPLLCGCWWGLPGGIVSVIDSKLAIDVWIGVDVEDDSPNETAGSVIVAG